MPAGSARRTPLRSRPRWKRPSAASAEKRHASSAPGAPTPESMPAARCAMSTSRARSTRPSCVTPSTRICAPRPVAIVAAAEAADEFHARFSATRRVYRYRIVNRRAPLALDSGRAWRVSAPLDRAAMARAAARLLGRHDFTSFRAAACQAASPMRTLDRLESRPRANRSSFPPRRAPSCTTRCAFSSARLSMSAAASGAPRR